ncbi:MAG: NRDE family protein [Balneolaceae bacterium]
MCLIVFSFRDLPSYPLILAGNRDEFYQRPTKQAHVWDTDPEFVAGKDLEAGGTWLGISQNGEFGAVTNYRNLYEPVKGDKSRGAIIPEFLTSDQSIRERIHSIEKQKNNFSGFNLIAGSAEKLFYVSNQSKSAKEISPGLHGISNAFLDTSWPKVELAKKEFKTSIQSGEIDREAVFELLQQSDPFPKEQLPDTGLSPEMERAVSPAFIKTADYGTRCSSLLTIDRNNRVQFIERTFNPGSGVVTSKVSFSFKIGNTIT